MKQICFFEMIMNHKNQFPFYRASERFIDSSTVIKQVLYMVEQKLEFKSHEP